MERDDLLSECAALAALTGPSVAIVRALDLFGYTERALLWAREVAFRETEILSEMLKDRMPAFIVTDRFARILFLYTVARDEPALRRYERALRLVWRQALETQIMNDGPLQGTAQNLLICAILLDKGDLASEASRELPAGPWRDLSTAWAYDDRTAFEHLAKQLAHDIETGEKSGSLNVLSDTWAYLLLDRVRRRISDPD